jgi:penicillin-binding protein 2
MFRQDEQRPMTSQFAVRVAVLSGLALVCFAVVFFRLWYLEVLSSDEYLEAAQNNRVREFTIQAPRGNIVDRNGEVLVRNRSALSLQVQPNELPARKGARNRMLRLLSEKSGMSLDEIKKEIRTQTKLLPSSPVTLERDVDRNLVYYLRERPDEFKGVTVEEVYVREYPESSLASHLFGYVSEISPELLEEPQYEALDPGDQIGAAGLELQYDSVLRGRNGASRIQVGASGKPRGEPLSQIEPKTGNNLVLTLDASVQKAGETALAGFGKPGAFVAMNVNDGSIVGMGSYPNFDPSVFTPPVDTDEYNALRKAETTPLTNRAFQSAYPTGSTFKLITALAALEEGLLTPTETIVDDGAFELGGLEPRTNAGGAVYGPLQLQRALEVSSDVFFYELGARNENDGDEAIQNWAQDLGLGAPTGIDLPYEAAGLVPTEEWRNELFEQAADPDSCSGKVRDYLNCGETDRPWSIGDSVNLAIGQGDVQAGPLQMAVAYATLANGGEVVRPHLAGEVTDPLGQPVMEYDPAPRRELDIEPAHRQVILDGLRDAAMMPDGTSYTVFGGFPIDIAGKTGTVERPPNPDQSWYVAIAPYDNPQVVVAVTVEGGGFGADTAAPITREILTAYLNIEDKKIKDVEGSTNAE